MSKWAFLEGFDLGADGDPYLDRLRILQTPVFAIYLHHIHREDRDRDPHDHPWTFASLILSGSYRETIRPRKADPRHTVSREHGKLTFHVMPRKAAHRVTSITGSLWTLVFTGPRVSNWGFWDKNGMYIPWQEYEGGEKIIAGEAGSQ